MPLRELERLAAVNRFLKLEISKENELQEIVNLAAQICETETALITLIDEHTQHIKFKVGCEPDTIPRADAFCNHVIDQNELMIVRDATLDNRFATNPFVISDPSIRFYAGSPLTTTDGLNLGSLCVLDKAPKELSDLQKKMLTALSRQVIQLLEIETSIKILKQQFFEAKRSEIELRSFFESSIDCHLLLGKNFEVLTFNKSVERLLSTGNGKLLERGKLIGPYLNADFLDDFTTNYNKALKGTAVFEEREINYGNRSTWWVIKYEPAFDPTGEIIGVSVNSTDVTARVEHAKIVSTQNNSLSEIAFIQSHQLRRPVASIMGLMELIKEDSRINSIEEIQLMQRAVLELDEKIHLVVGYTDYNKSTT